MKSLIGHPMGLHLNLTGWVSTQRDWHSDDYLNPHFVYSHYVAVWIALEDISINSGPFEFVRGSHRWPPLRQDKLFTKISKEEAKNPDWPWTTEGIVVNACESEITRRGAKIEKYLPSKGDVMFWHGRLLHRGSKPTVPGTSRKSLISHYSSINHRPDFAVQAIYKKTGGHYFYVEQYINPSLDAGVMKNKSINKLTTLHEKNSSLAMLKFPYKGKIK